MAEGHRARAPSRYKFVRTTETDDIGNVTPQSQGLAR